MDHRLNTIEQRHSPVGRGGARAAPDRLPPEPVRAAALPVRRSGALEAAAHALDARGLGGALALGQAEDEWGGRPVAPRPAARRGARRRPRPCRVGDRLPGRTADRDALRPRPDDGRQAGLGRRVVDLAGRGGLARRTARQKMLALYPGWARPTAEERA